MKDEQVRTYKHFELAYFELENTAIVFSKEVVFLHDAFRHQILIQSINWVWTTLTDVIGAHCWKIKRFCFNVRMINLELLLRKALQLGLEVIILGKVLMSSKIIAHKRRKAIDIESITLFVNFERKVWLSVIRSTQELFEMLRGVFNLF